LPGIGAYEQGNGLVNVGAAWEALKRAPAPVAISSSVDINVAIGPYLTTPNNGPGIFEREGWRAGQSGQRTITFIRSSGNSEPVNYVVRWYGNDGSFSSATKIRLPLNQPVPVPITIDVKTSGVHSAILNLDDETSGARSVYQVMNTVIAAEQFSASENFMVTREGVAEYPSYTSFFFNVPENASAFKADLKIQHGNLRMRFLRPTGKEFDHGNETPPRWPAGYQTEGSVDRLIANPEPGVWEVIVENQDLLAPGDSETRRGSFSITATVYRAEPNSLSNQLTTRVGDVLNKQQVQFANYFASLDGYVAEAPLASAFSARPVLGNGNEPVIYEINVPQGAATLRARIDGPSTKAADVDLYLYFCAAECELKAFSARSGVREQVTIAQPKGGKWKVVIDPVLVPSGPLTLDYIDLFTHTAFGSLTPLTGNITFTKEAASTVEVAAKIDAVPVNGRRLVGLVDLLTRESVTVGHVYNPATKSPEPIKERVTLAERIVELRGDINQPNPLTGSARRP